MNQTSGKKPLDLVETARNMIDAAIAVTTGRLRYASPAETLAILRQGDDRAVREFRSELSRQIAGALLLMDPRIHAVYEDQGTVIPGHGVDTPLDAPFRLWIQVHSRTAALSAAVEALNIALVQAFQAVTPDPPQALVEALIVDERDSRILRVGDPLVRAEPVLLGQRKMPG